MGWIFYLKNKSDAYPTMQNFVTFIERQHNTKILSFMTDNGGEYVEIDSFFTSKGIRHIRIPPYSHQSNGVSERYN